MTRKTLLTILFSIFVILNILLLYFIFIDPNKIEDMEDPMNIEMEEEFPIPGGGFEVLESEEEPNMEGESEDMLEEEDFSDTIEEPYEG